MYAKLLLVAALLIHQDKAPSCHLKAAKKLCMVCHKERSPNKEQSRQLFPTTAEVREAVAVLTKAKDPVVSRWSAQTLQQQSAPNSFPSIACHDDDAQLRIHAICRNNIWNARRALQRRIEKVGGTTTYFFFCDDNMI